MGRSYTGASVEAENPAGRRLEKMQVGKQRHEKEEASTRLSEKLDKSGGRLRVTGVLESSHQVLPLSEVGRA